MTDRVQEVEDVRRVKSEAASHRRCAGTAAAAALAGLSSGSPAGRGGGCSPRSERGWCPAAQTLDSTHSAAHKHTHSAEPASDAS